MDHLVDEALAWSLVGSPSKQPGAVPEPVSGDLIIEHLDNQLTPQRLPFAFLAVVPPAGSAGCLAGEARRFDERLQPSKHVATLARGDA